jgi:hypothetical protein
MSVEKKGKSAILCSGKVNRKGYRLWVDGVRLKSFQDNPIMLYRHMRTMPDGRLEEVSLPIGRWDNIRVENGKLIADPNFDMDDEFATKIARKWENGYLNATSVAHTFDKVSDDIMYIVDGQTLATVIEWEVLEASIVDIPGDKEAIKLSHGNDPLSILPLIQKVKTDIDMDLKAIAHSLGLPATATEAEVNAKITALQNAQVEGILELGRSKGVVTDANIAVMRTQVTANPEFAKLSWEQLPDPKTEATVPTPTTPVTTPTQGTLSAVLRELQGLAAPVQDERKSWTITDWRTNDPQGFLSLETTNKPLYDSLINSLIKTAGAVSHIEGEKRRNG